MDFVEPETKFQVEVNNANNHILFFNHDDTKLKIECPSCHSKQWAWVAGDETSRVNGLRMNTSIHGNGNQVVGIHIGGSLVGSSIIIGNNKVS